MSIHVLRLLEDRLDAEVSTPPLPVANRMIYCAKGNATVDGEGFGVNQVAFSAGSCVIKAGEAGAQVLRYELVPAPVTDDGRIAVDGVVSSPKLACDINLSGTDRYLMRCDRTDFPRGAIADSHTHVGPGIRYLMKGSLRIDSMGESLDYGPGGAWFEAGPDPVLATAATNTDSFFIRVLVLPRDYEGRPSATFLSPANKDKPKPLGRTLFRDAFITT